MAVTESVSMVLCALETYLYPHTVLLKRGAAHLRAPVRLRFGGGAAHGNHSGTFATHTGARAGVQSNAQGQGKAPMGSWAFGDAVMHRCKARSPGWPHRDPVRPQAHLLPSLIHGEIYPYRTPCHASICNTPHGPIYGLRRLTLCPCHVFSPSGSDIFGRPDYSGERAPPLQKTPT